jgi:hypothetical protein
VSWLPQPVEVDAPALRTAYLQQLWARDAQQSEAHRAIDGYAVTLLAAIGVTLGLAATAADHFHAAAHASLLFPILLFTGLFLVVTTVGLLLILLVVLLWRRKPVSNPLTWSKLVAPPWTQPAAFDRMLEVEERRLNEAHENLRRHRLWFQRCAVAFALSLLWFGIAVTIGVKTGEIRVISKIESTSGTPGPPGRQGNPGQTGTPGGQGNPGPPGRRGEAGPAGRTGNPGAAGPPGRQGVPGISVVPSPPGS